MTLHFQHIRMLRFLVIADALAFGFFYLLPQFEQIHSHVAISTLELDGYGALMAMSHPLSITLATFGRLISLAFLFFDHRFGRYFLLLTVLFAGTSALIGGLSVLTSLDLFAMTVLYLLDGALLAKTFLTEPPHPEPLSDR